MIAQPICTDYSHNDRGPWPTHASKSLDWLFLQLTPSPPAMRVRFEVCGVAESEEEGSCLGCDAIKLCLCFCRMDLVRVILEFRNNATRISSGTEIKTGRRSRKK